MKISSVSENPALTTRTPQLDKNPQDPPAGTLLISDDFTPGDPYEHGYVGIYAARHIGFEGNIATQSYFSPKTQLASENAAWGKLTEKTLNREQALRRIEQYSSNYAIGLLDGQSNAVKRATDKGFRNSAMNISFGVSEARASKNLYDRAAQTWLGKTPEERQAGRKMLGNLATAYGVNPSELPNRDSKVSGPARHKLQQALVDHMAEVFRKPEMTAAKERFRNRVADFESKNNSVVISSGNQGNVEEAMERDNGGRDVRVSDTFERTVLLNDLVTSVGATRFYNSTGERVASYTNQIGARNDIYASGSTDSRNKKGRATEYGTSFAAPRAAAIMAELHRRNPTLTSSEVENLMRQSLTREVPAGVFETTDPVMCMDTPEPPTVKALDYQRVAEFLSGRTY